MSSFPNQLISTDSDQHGNCCCVYCPGGSDCDLCPDRLIQAPNYAFDCSTGATPPCGGIFSPPLIQVNRQGDCDMHGLLQPWCDPQPGLNDFVVLASCGDPGGGIGLGLVRWYVQTTLFVCSSGCAGIAERVHSLFVNFTAALVGEPGTPNEQCVPTGIYTHVGTWVDSGGTFGTLCHPVLVAPLGDLQVIAL